MDDKDRSIATQVAFKGAVDNGVSLGVNLGSPEGQSWFEETFSYLTESLMQAIATHAAVEGVVKAFPGTQVVPQQGYAQPNAQAVGYQQGFQQMPTPAVLPLKVKGNQFGPLPDWLHGAAAEKGVTEVYDNRDRAMGTKRPWFKATTGGDNAPAFWPPRD